VLRFMASFRMRIDGDHDHRAHALDETKELFGESSRTGAVMAACEHSRRDIKAKQEAIEWMEQNLTPEQASELCEILSTSDVQLSVEMDASVSVE
jgi:hypothetical protein